MDTQVSAPQSESAAKQLVAKEIMSLIPGQTVQGKVVSRDGENVQVKLLNDLLLNAKMDQNMNLEIGKNLTFEIKNNGRNLTLSPLFTNTSTDTTLLKALDMANLPVNDTTISMTKEMMAAGLSVDRNSLSLVYREIEGNAKAEVLDIVDLHRLGLPVTEENVNQISAYRNMNHQLFQAADTFAEDLHQMVSSLVEQGEPKMAAQLVLDITGSLELSEENLASESGITEAQDPGVSKEDLPKEQMPNAEKAVGSQDENQNRIDNPNEMMENGGNIETKSNSMSSFNTEQNANGTDSFSKWIHSLQEAVQSNSDEKSNLLKELLTGDEGKKFFAQKLQDKWNVEPKDLNEPGKLDDFYQKAHKQLQDITNLLEKAGQTDTALMRDVSNMRENLDFMHQLNQVYNYVQLPLKLGQNNAHGDLYVYTNKKNLMSSDGQISALLHLDMEHLGPVDVYVAMQSEKVNTRFYVQDDSMLDFLNEHMHILTERLQKRGYDIHVTMQQKDAPQDSQGAIRPFLEPTSGKAVSIQNMAFDVRA